MRLTAKKAVDVVCVCSSSVCAGSLSLVLGACSRPRHVTSKQIYALSQHCSFKNNLNLDFLSGKLIYISCFCALSKFRRLNGFELLTFLAGHVAPMYLEI